MKIMVCGPQGFLGTAFLKAIPSAIPSQVDICDPEQVGDALDRHRPDVVINCAGKTGQPNIDWCETNKLVTAQANITGPLVLLGECMARDVFLAHIGSGCIFEGDNQGRGFSEKDPPNYRGSYYSRTKISTDTVLKEFPVLILRLRMPFDNSVHPRNLLCRLATYQKVLDVQNSFTYLPDFVEVACQLINRRATGIYHIANPGTTSPYDIMVRYQTIVDPNHNFERLDADGLAELVTTGRSNCVLSSHKLESEGLKLQPVGTAVDMALQSLRAELTQSVGSSPSTKEHVES